MLLMFDTIAKRYGKLPSEVLRTADSFDIMIMDVALTYEKYQSDKAHGRPTVKTEDFTQEELKSIMEKSKSGRKSKQQTST